jgi:hypothetical protein
MAMPCVRERGGRGGPAWWRRGCGGAAWLGGVEEKPFVRRVRRQDRVLGMPAGRVDRVGARRGHELGRVERGDDRRGRRR